MNWYFQTSAVHIKSSLDPDGHKHIPGLQPAGEVRKLVYECVFSCQPELARGVVIYHGWALGNLSFHILFASVLVG